MLYVPTFKVILKIEVAQGYIFFLEQKMRFGLVLDRLAVLKKKIGADYELLLKAVFSCFQWQKKQYKFFFSVYTKKLHNISLIFFGTK